MPTDRPDYFCALCPTCGVPDNYRHLPTCRLMHVARQEYEDDDHETVVPDWARIEAVDGGYRVEASVYVDLTELDDPEDDTNSEDGIKGWTPEEEDA